MLNESDSGRLRRQQLQFHDSADASRFENRIRNPFVVPKERVLAARIAALIRTSNGRVLEVGSGEGSNLWFLREKLPSCHFVAVDFSVPKMKFLIGQMSSVQAAAADALHLPFGPGEFDLVLCRDLLHHVNWNRDAVVGEAIRVLKPGAVVVVLESNGRALLSRLFRLLYPVEHGMRDSTPEALFALGARYGKVRLEFVEASFLVRAVAFATGWLRNSSPSMTLVYRAALQWERLVEWALPQHKWTYMLMTIGRNE